MKESFFLCRNHLLMEKHQIVGDLLTDINTHRQVTSATMDLRDGMIRVRTEQDMDNGLNAYIQAIIRLHECDALIKDTTSILKNC